MVFMLIQPLFRVYTNQEQRVVAGLRTAKVHKIYTQSGYNIAEYMKWVKNICNL